LIDAPFPWFGGKSRAASLIWQRFGDVRTYVEPFFGSGAVLLSRPAEERIETINDLDGYVANFWRAIQANPDEVAFHADWPINEADLMARHLWLVAQRGELLEQLMADPDFWDAKIAGWWVWGICSWIGSGWCSGDGPWIVGEDGKVANGNAGQGVRRQLPHLGAAGQGVHRKRPHLGTAGRGLTEWFQRLADRLRRVRVCCGDWSRVCGPSVTWKHGVTGVMLDPPYADSAGRSADLYSTDSLTVAHAVREWAIEAGQRPDMRIAICGYEGEHDMPDGWECVAWKASGGYGSQGDVAGRENSNRERIWFSPACLGSQQGALL